VADGFKLMSAFVKYARGTQAIVKRAEIEAELEALAEGENMDGVHSSNDGDDDLMAMISDTNSELEDVKSLMEEDKDMEDEHEKSLFETVVEEGEVEADALADDHKDDDNDLKAGDLKPETQLKPEMLSQAFNSKAGRAALRAKLAADALGKQDDGQVQDMSRAHFSDMLDEANDLADGQTELDVKPSNNLGYVETLSEVNKSMMDLAKAPPKVRKEAEAIHKLVSEGKLDPSDLDELVSEGLDKDAVAYYRKYWGQVDGGSEFANELAKEHVKAKMEEELNNYKVKIARAYELAYDMVERGLCASDRIHVTAQVEEIMKFNDESFESLKRVVAQHNPMLQKSAHRMPQVGFIGAGETHSATSADDDWSQLSAAFAKTNKRLF
jgi:K+/H+ antiporter YhaU regulatory subunit KhtT